MNKWERFREKRVLVIEDYVAGKRKALRKKTVITLIKTV